MKKLIIILMLATGPAYAQKIDSCQYYRQRCDTLSHRLYMANTKIASVKRFVKIVDKNPKQIKFLKGWINRVIK